MCSSPDAPTPPPTLPEAPRAPEITNTSTADIDKRRKAAAGGQGRSTILTSARGVQEGGTTATKTLLGE